MTVYLLYYDYDSGAREDWNTFYTPVEVFANSADRQNRQTWLTLNYPNLEFHQVDVEISGPNNVNDPSKHGYDR